jgi:hypothetical protein
LSSVFTVAAAAGTGIVVHNYHHVPAGSFYFYLFAFEFAAFVFYDAWIILRDRALQCVFFRTPKRYFLPVCFLVACATLHALYFNLVWPTGSKFVWGASSIQFYMLQYYVQLVILVAMTCLFVRPLLFERGSGMGVSQVLLDVARRTALGAFIHVLTSVFYLVCLVLWNVGYLCELGRGAVFQATMLGFILHVNISHRDDLPLRRVCSVFLDFLVASCAHNAEVEEVFDFDQVHSAKSGSSGSSSIRFSDSALRVTTAGRSLIAFISDVDETEHRVVMENKSETQGSSTTSSTVLELSHLSSLSSEISVYSKEEWRGSDQPERGETS